MAKARYFAFAAFRLDMLDERLWNDDESIPLGHKAFAVLARLVAVPTSSSRRTTSWLRRGRTRRSCEAVLTTAMREIRVAVGDTARTPQFVQTVTRPRLPVHRACRGNQRSAPCAGRDDTSRRRSRPSLRAGGERRGRRPGRAGRGMRAPAPVARSHPAGDPANRIHRR